MSNFVEFCCDRRLRTFLKVRQKNCNIHVQNKGGGVKGRLNNVKKKLHFWYWMASLTSQLLSLQTLSKLAPEGPVRCKRWLVTDGQNPIVGVGKSF